MDTNLVLPKISLTSYHSSKKTFILGSATLENLPPPETIMLAARTIYLEYFPLPISTPDQDPGTFLMKPLQTPPGRFSQCFEERLINGLN